jgi:Trypsin-like serine proteases, typically periplasmic, contain C-terminal PDZ domain
MKTRLSLIIYGLLFLLFPSAVRTQNVDYSNLVEQIKPSIALVKALDTSGKVVKTGTRFYVANGLILTNYHVIEGAARISVQTDSSRSDEAQVDSSKPDSDLALLKVNGVVGNKGLQFAKEVPKVGQRVVVVGNPLGLIGTVSDGIVSAIRKFHRVRYLHTNHSSNLPWEQWQSSS